MGSRRRKNLFSPLPLSLTAFIVWVRWRKEGGGASGKSPLPSSLRPPSPDSHFSSPPPPPSLHPDLSSKPPFHHPDTGRWRRRLDAQIFPFPFILGSRLSLCLTERCLLPPQRKQPQHFSPSEPNFFLLSLGPLRGVGDFADFSSLRAEGDKDTRVGAQAARDLECSLGIPTFFSFSFPFLFPFRSAPQLELEGPPRLLSQEKRGGGEILLPRSFSSPLRTHFYFLPLPPSSKEKPVLMLDLPFYILRPAFIWRQSLATKNGKWKKTFLCLSAQRKVWVTSPLAPKDEKRKKAFF